MMLRLLLLILLLISISCSAPEGKDSFPSKHSATRTIAIQPYGQFEKSLIDTISLTISKAYGLPVTILPKRALPSTAFINIKSPRYRADSLLKDLKRNKPKDVSYILGLTRSDISTTKRDKLGRIKQPEYKYHDFGIFGLGYRPGPCSIVSTYRIKHNDPKVFRTRLKKICVHELGHNMGLPHCPNEGCVMQDANETIRTIDSAEMELCPSCRKRIH